MATRRFSETSFRLGDPNDKAGPPAVNDVYSLGDATPSGYGYMPIQLDNTGTFVGSLTLVARKRGDTTRPFRTVPYKSNYLNGAAGTGALVTTAITTDSLIEAQGGALEFGLLVTAYTSGYLDVGYTPVSSGTA
jgi:hypothetical protein